jgi:hypothetical protein
VNSYGLQNGEKRETETQAEDGFGEVHGASSERSSSERSEWLLIASQGRILHLNDALKPWRYATKAVKCGESIKINAAHYSLN